MLAAFEPKYTPGQRDALAYAYEDRRIRPASRVVELAARGELEYQGLRLEGFDTTENTVRDEARKLRKRRAGETTSQLAQAAPRDAIEQLRRRLINAADAMLQDVERQKPADRDPERLRQLARAAREIAALPGPTDPRPPAPGTKQDGKRDGGETRGGLAGAILKSHRQASDGSAAPAEPTTRQTTDTTSPTGGATSDDTPTNAETDGEPGSVVRALAARCGVELSA